MKHVVCLCWMVWAAGLSAPGTLGAQVQNDRELDITAAEMAASLKKELDLTDEQVLAVTPAFEYHLRERKRLYARERQGASKRKLRQAVRKVREEVEKQIAEHITPEQLEKWKASQPPPDKDP